MTAVQPAAIRRKVEDWLRKSEDQAPAIALRSRPDWTNDPVLTFGATIARVVPCPTPLAAWAALGDRRDGERLVLLTELTDGQLGDGLLAYVSLNTVRRVDAWEIAAGLFGASQNDPMLIREGRWVADALIDLVPTDGWPPALGTVLSRDLALASLVAEALGIDSDQLDGAGLMDWTTEAAKVLRATQRPAAVLDGIRGYLSEVGGPGAAAIMAAVRSGNGADAVPLGLLAGALWPAPSGGPRATAVAVAQTRLERYFGGTRPGNDEAAALHTLALAYLGRVGTSDDEGRRKANGYLVRAEKIAQEIDATDLLGGSDVLPTGFLQRLQAVAVAVRLGAAGGRPAAAVTSAERALAYAEAHRGADAFRLEAARMAVRLLRWLESGDGPQPATLYDALLRQVRDDGFVDRARLDVFVGDVDPVVAEAYHLLHREVDARRARHDQRFATLLAEATEHDAEPGALIRVEDVFDRVVHPVLDNGKRVLLLVLDGMSVAASTELAESMTRTGSWMELTPQGQERVGVLAALPTITEVSRCSLFTGRIATGEQKEELAAFNQRFPTGLLLHKSRLRAGAGAAFDPDVIEALGDPNAPVVAAVVNTIDDALDRSDPGTTVWGTETIQAVRDLLTLASDRVVIVVSDHGHVVDRGPDAVTRPSSSSENRWRPSDHAVGDGEVLVRGPRVAKGDGEVVLPWREEIRYGPRKAGYHGGASAAEVVIPLLMFSAGDENAVPGWAGAPVASPSWWWPANDAETPSSLPSPASQSWLVESVKAGKPHKAARPPSQAQAETLFDTPAGAAASKAEAAPEPTAQPSQADRLVAALLASDTYAQRRGGRGGLPDNRVAAMVRILLTGRGRSRVDMLATQAGIPAHRINSTITALRKVLQVEGYPVLQIDPDGQTVILDIALLVEQFGLDQK
ncbi:PglZ domain-containing protein [Asanoa ferruginea]|uniref:PglZ domain-containing protein n=1 Tax=Asanoa ferruginea TaxID=53367 RepID=A0A3D9ZH51_9ACTN|nr:BREX-2 system phosphatase PglZ [Asanoa ferruginea]REF96179.1 PglZ domain-containing protein [Asanoa ferruginea]GIF49323.1 hypothetical protein Afe04nite_38620 [Asanoa ferruginea]